MSGPRLSRSKRVLFAIVPLLLLLVAGELAARLFWEPPTQERAGIGMDAHPTRIWGLKPGAQTAFGAPFSVGADGLREVEASGSPYVALTLGDSSIFGHGLSDDDTLHAAMRRGFADRGIKVDVRCGAIPGYSTEQSLALMDEVGWSLDPDLLMIGNLWSDNDLRYFSDREWMAELAGTNRGPEWALRRSELWRFLTFQVDPPQQESLPVGWVRDPYATGRRRVPLMNYGQNLDRLLLQAAERGVSTVMLSPCNRWLANADHLGKTTVWDAYFTTMHMVAERRGVPLVKACDLLRPRGLDGDTAFLDEMHPTGLVNNLYGAAIADTMTAHGWPFKAVVPDASPPLWDVEIPESWDEARESQDKIDSQRKSAHPQGSAATGGNPG